MRVARDRLLAVLEAASPALATTRNLVPGLSHFWFDGDSVTAFNDVLGIRVILAGDFTGGVEGERLLGLLKNSNAKNVTLEARTKGRNPVLAVTVGSAGVILPLRPITESLFREQFPYRLDDGVPVVSAQFIEALKLVMLSCVTRKVASPAERGVTLIEKGSTIDLFATDELTISWARVEDCPLFPKKPGRAIWPREFCDYFVKHFRDGTYVAMVDDEVWCNGGVPSKPEPLEVTVYTKLVGDNSPVNFLRFVAEYEHEIAVAFKIPDDLNHALLRAAAMVPEKTPVDLEVTTVDDLRVLRLYANTTAGEFDDLIEVAADGHADLTVKADAALIRRALPGRASLAVTPGSVILTGPPGFFHFISVRR